MMKQEEHVEALKEKSLKEYYNRSPNINQKQQMSPSAIVDSPNELNTIQAPNSSQVNAFKHQNSNNKNIQNKDYLKSRSAVADTQNNNMGEKKRPTQSQQQLVAAATQQNNKIKMNILRKSNNNSMPFKHGAKNQSNISKSGGLASSSLISSQSVLVTTNAAAAVLKTQASSSNQVGSSMTKKHLHYFKHSAVTNAESMTSSTQQIPHHKQSQSSQMTNLTRNQLFQSPLFSQQACSFYTRNRANGDSFSKRLAPASSWHAADSLIGQQISTENFQSVNSLQSNQNQTSQQIQQAHRTSSNERHIPIQKVRVAKKVPTTANTANQPQSTMSGEPQKVLMKSAGLNLKIQTSQNGKSQRIRPVNSFSQSTGGIQNVVTQSSNEQQARPGGTTQQSTGASQTSSSIIQATAKQPPFLYSKANRTERQVTNELLLLKATNSQQIPTTTQTKKGMVSNKGKQSTAADNAQRAETEVACLLSPQRRLQSQKDLHHGQNNSAAVNRSTKQNSTQKKIGSQTNLSSLTVMNHFNKNLKSTKILRKHVNFEVSKPASTLQKLSTQSGQQQDLKSLQRQKALAESLNLQSTLSRQGETLAKSQSLCDPAPAASLLEKQEEVAKEDTDKRNALGSQRHAKKPSVVDLEIEIPQSPQLQVDDGADKGQIHENKEQQDVGRKQTNEITQVLRQQIGIVAHHNSEPRGRNTLIQPSARSANMKLKGVVAANASGSQSSQQIASPSALQYQPSASSGLIQQTSHQQQALTRQHHQSPLLESIQAATHQHNAANERPLQVYRPNCQSTRHLPSRGGGLTGSIHGCVPPTAPPAQVAHRQGADDGNGNEALPQGEGEPSRPHPHTTASHRLPPAPQTGKPHQQSRSQSGARQKHMSSNGTNENYDSVRTDSLAAHKQSGPLAQYANYAFQPACKILLPPHLSYESSKTSVRRNGVVRGYAANTHQGLIRNYNEDRVSIILNISEPESRKNMDPAHGENSPWPVCSFFGIYDGHGGSQCADFLRDNLHTLVVREPCFPDDPREAIKLGFSKAERIWTEQRATRKDESTGQTLLVDRSGSCAIVVIIIEEMCYVANVGDSRAVLSGEAGKRVFALSRDHKPGDEHERQRILQAGGKIYSRQLPSSTKNQLGPQAADEAGGDSREAYSSPVQGPERIFPGRLSVSRSFGDVEAKLPEFGGNPDVLIATPEIKAFRIKREHDFIALGCDGIFDRISNKEAVNVVWKCTEDLERLYPGTKTVHQLSGLGVDYLIKNCLLRRSLDNVTAVLVAFRNFKHAVWGDDGELVGAKIIGGQNRPNTTKAVPQVAMKVKATNSKLESSAKADARANSQALLLANTRQSVQGVDTTSQTAPRVNSCRTLPQGPSSSQDQLSVASKPEHTPSRDNLGSRIDCLVNKNITQASETKTLTRQDKQSIEENARVSTASAGNISVPIKSSSMVPLSQRVVQQKATTLLENSANLAHSRRKLPSGSHLPPSHGSLSSEAKIPQFMSRDSLQQRLTAKKMLQKSQSGGAAELSSIKSLRERQESSAGYSSSRGTEEAKKSFLLAQSKKQAMPRFFKFEEAASDRDDQERHPDGD